MKSTNPNIKVLEIEEGINAWSIPMDSRATQFSFSLERNEILWMSSSKNSISAESSFIPHPIVLNESESMFLAYPREPWTIDIQDEHKSLLCVVISLNALHRLIEANFDEDNIDQEELDYSDMSKVVSLSPKVMSELTALFTGEDVSIFKGLQRKGKFLSAFSSMMEKLFGNMTDQCPFQMDRVTEQKIRDVRSLIIEDLSLQPDMQQLSFTADIPKSILKQGFKHLYGKSIYNFYNDYRMDKAESLLEGGQHLVKEIAFEIGYQNPSHFIAAFKKRKGCTPKQYMKNY